MVKNSRDGYGWLIILLHWGMALLLGGLFALGWYMTELTYYDRWYKDAFDLHKAFGIVALALAMLRIGWLAASPAPSHPASMTPLETRAAAGVHRLLYLLMLAIPLSGYLISTAKGAGVGFFGLFEIPALLPPAEGREEWAGRVHYFLAFGGAWIVLFHAAAALKHHYYDKDVILLRMLGSGKARGASATSTNGRSAT